MLAWSLGPSPGWPLKRMPGAMRFPEDLRRTIVFLGHESDRPGHGGISCIGTGFFVYYENCMHIVTARHIAAAVANGPFLIRINTTDGGSRNYLTDEEVRWQVHETDDDVDLAASFFPMDFEGCDVKAVQSGMIADAAVLKSHAVGVGDQAYTVGLFRVLHGKQRNLPVVHTGNIALLPGDERIPVVDWDDQSKRRLVEGYLVEGQGLQGLSGAPVFARPTFISPEFHVPGIGGLYARLSRVDLVLLGVWQGAWDAKTDAVLTADRGKEMRVPVGMGVVVPAAKLIEVLEMPKLKKEREVYLARGEQNVAASLDAVPPASDANPNHLTDFTRLVDVAARKRPQGDQT